MAQDPLEEVRLHKQLDKLDAFLLSGEIGLAKEGFTAILGERPDHPLALHGLGLIAVHEGKLEEAESLLRQATQQEPDNARFWNDLGEALRLLQRHDEAADAYRHALELRPDYVPAANNLGVTMAMMGDVAAAEAQFQKTLQLAPEDPYAYNNLGVLWQQHGRFEEALGAYETAVRLKPDFTEALDNYRDLAQAHPELITGSLRRLAELLQAQNETSADDVEMEKKP